MHVSVSESGCAGDRDGWRGHQSLIDARMHRWFGRRGKRLCVWVESGADVRCAGRVRLGWRLVCCVDSLLRAVYPSVCVITVLDEIDQVLRLSFARVRRGLAARPSRFKKRPNSQERPLSGDVAQAL